MTILTGAGVEKPEGRRQGRHGDDQGQGRQGRRAATSATVIVAIGIVPNTENIGLETLGVKTDQAAISRPTPMAAPTCQGIWAIGDVTAPPWLAHKASHEGVIASRRSRRSSATRTCIRMRSTRSNIPGCTYCRPQVASVGLTEAKAKEAGYEVKVGKFPVHRQRQGDRARRGRGLRQDGVRRQDRRAARRAHDRRRGDRADPGLHRRQDRRAGRGRADAAPSSRTRR